MTRFAHSAEEVEGRGLLWPSTPHLPKLAVGCIAGSAIVYISSNSLAYKFAAGLLTASASSVAFIGLYIVKSAVGIDLLPGPSFMHDMFYIF